MDPFGRAEVKLGDTCDLSHRWTPGSVRMLIELIGRSSTCISIASAAVLALATLPAQFWGWIDLESLTSHDTLKFLAVVEGVLLKASSASLDKELAMLSLYKMGIICQPLREAFITSAANIMPRIVKASRYHNIKATGDPSSDLWVQRTQKVVLLCQVKQSFRLDVHIICPISFLIGHLHKIVSVTVLIANLTLSALSIRCQDFVPKAVPSNAKPKYGTNQGKHEHAFRSSRSRLYELVPHPTPLEVCIGYTERASPC